MSETPEERLQRLREQGSKGGKAKVPKGFALSGKASEASKKSHANRKIKNAKED